MYEISGFPFPPSANHLHVPTGRFRRRNSPQYIAFQHECKVFALGNRAQLKEIALWAKGKLLAVHFAFISPKERLYCKDGSVKRFDHHNLLKAILDSLGEIIEVDDRMFFEVSCIKVVGPSNKVNIQILEL